MTDMPPAAERAAVCMNPAAKTPYFALGIPLILVRNLAPAGPMPHPEEAEDCSQSSHQASIRLR
ncbi:MAG: hypothetical protein AB199_02465 [Parcubacteria bacterium C7867-004]|nr:MAG: hypothetical protein AB199_02465 [Parcubacteria bacterium C7867-004]